MDDNTTKLLENPHQSSHKKLYLVLVLILVGIVVALTFLRERQDIIERNLVKEQILRNLNAEPVFTLTEAQKTQARRDIAKSSTVALSDQQKEDIIKSLQE